MGSLRGKGIAAATVFCLATALSAMAASLGAGQEAAFRVVDADGEPVVGAVLTLTPLDAQPDGPVDAPDGVPVLDQADTAFEPTVVLVRAGGTVRLRNSDPFNHHVYSFSRVKQFDAVMRADGAEKEIVLEEPGVVAVGCNIHDQMRGFIYVIAAPHYRETGAAGDAVFEDLAPGRYVLRPWHPLLRGRPARWEQEVTIDAEGGVKTVAIDLRAGRREGAGRGKERRKY
ncbi:MAG: methylamine utilization protein [Alphaproteobacteria bacterium]|nr:methylamine utilization protein [Alphaproteobacteria bacterium]